MFVVDSGVLARGNDFTGLRSDGGHVTKKMRLREDDPPDRGGTDMDTIVCG